MRSKIGAEISFGQRVSDAFCGALKVRADDAKGCIYWQNGSIAYQWAPWGPTILGQTPWEAIIDAKKDAEKLMTDRPRGDEVKKRQALSKKLRAVADALKTADPRSLRGLNREIGGFPVGDRRAVITAMGLIETTLVACEMLADVAGQTEPEPSGAGRPRNEPYYAVAREVASLFQHVTGEWPKASYETAKGGPVGTNPFCRALFAVFKVLGMTRSGVMRLAADKVCEGAKNPDAG